VAIRIVIFDDRRLAKCTACGMCLPSCPTYQVTRLEQHGPRGRILGMRLVQAGELAPDDPQYVDSMETCIQCRECEPVCPSRVEFGLLMEQARYDLARRQSLMVSPARPPCPQSTHRQ